jgi:hypothetical protein
VVVVRLRLRLRQRLMPHLWRHQHQQQGAVAPRGRTSVPLAACRPLPQCRTKTTARARSTWPLCAVALLLLLQLIQKLLLQTLGAQVGMRLARATTALKRRTATSADVGAMQDRRRCR